MTDQERLEWLLSRFYCEDNAWLASFCFSCDKGGIRAAIDKYAQEEAKLRKEAA